jgi:hypothetical protein
MEHEDMKHQKRTGELGRPQTDLQNPSFDYRAKATDSARSHTMESLRQRDFSSDYSFGALTVRRPEKAARNS